VATIALWARSYSIHDTLRFGNLPPCQELDSIQGQLVFIQARKNGVNWNYGPIQIDLNNHAAQSPPTQYWGALPTTAFAATIPPLMPMSESQRLWFHADTAAITLGGSPGFPFSGCKLYSLAIPFWFLILAFAALPLWTARRIWKTNVAIKRGLCHHCGYDLRATPDRCPECGSVPNTTASMST
jgi:hypothetical protein